MDIETLQIEGRLAVALFIACPKSFGFARTCANRPSFWRWKSCGHKDFIDDTGNLWCPPKDCNYKWFIQDVAFKCNDVRHGN
jgi:hypothetical protein